MTAYRRFNTLFLAMTLPVVAGVGGINAVVDPLGIIGSPDIAGLTHLKTEQFDHVRLFKAADVVRLQPKTVLLGSSRSDLGLDPDHPAFADTQPAYNLALVGPNMYEVRRYFEHALANQPDLERVVLGIDFFMFNEYKQNTADFNDDRLEQRSITSKDFLTAIFSHSALTASLETLRSSLQADADYLYRQDGMRYVHENRLEQPAAERFRNGISGYLNSSEYYGTYQLSPQLINDLRILVETCRARNIELKVFISPSHVTEWETIRAAGLWAEFEDWKRQIAQITPFWDFSGYNTVTSEPIQNHMKYYWDNSHYRKEAGDLVINRLFAYEEEKVPADFGVLVTAQNVDVHLAHIRSERIAWMSDNAKTVAFVRDVHWDERSTCRHTDCQM